MKVQSADPDIGRMGMREKWVKVFATLMFLGPKYT